MDLVITGHTRNIGKYIYDHFGGVGLSLSQGFDITKDNIASHINKNTVFINNAFTYTDLNAQEKMLEQSLHAKKIIVIGTNTQFEGLYKDAKDKLKNKCSQYFHQGYDITYLAFGKVDTTFQLNNNDPKISKEYVVECVDFILKSPYRVETISIRPD